MKKVAIIGPESSGKTVLTHFLADHFSGIHIEEKARNYLHQLSEPYTLQDVENIAKLQWGAIQQYQNENQWLFCDTELLVIALWTQEVFQTSIPWVQDSLAHQPFDHFLLCAPDLPWHPDPLREAPDLATRKRYFNWFENQLQNIGYPYSIIKGKEREALAIQQLHL